MSLWINTFIKFFFLLTPFWVVSTFLSMTQAYTMGARRKLAVRVTLAVIVTCVILIFAGNAIFRMFDITIDSFRIGAGGLLFLSAVNLVHGKPAKTSEPGQNTSHDVNEDIAVVPLTIPITVGPGTTGALLVMGTDFHTVQEKVIGGSALLVSILCVGCMLVVASNVQKILGQKGLNVLSKLTGLILAALSAQLIMTGIKGMLDLG